MKYIGNKALLDRHKVGFSAMDIPHLTGPTSLLIQTTYDRADKLSKRADISVVGGFHSSMEKSVLNILLRGACGIIIVLARGMYKRIPKEWQAAMNDNRLLVISLEKDSSTRVTVRSSKKRDKYIEKTVNEFWNMEVW